MLNVADHSYLGLISGKPRRSVTTMLAEEGYIAKQFYREGRQELGTQGHKMLDLYDKGERFTAPEVLARYIKPYQAMLDHTGIQIVDSEVEIENIMLEYSGTLDKLCLHPSKGHGIMDVKFSSCGYVAWHEYQSELYRQGLLWHPKYKGLDIRWKAGIIMKPDCEIPTLIMHDRIPGISKICQAIAIVNKDKHERKIHLPKLTQEEGWLE